MMLKLDYNKMVAHVNLNHPRIVKNEDDQMTFEPLPMSTEIGTLVKNVYQEE